VPGTAAGVKRGNGLRDKSDGRLGHEASEDEAESGSGESQEYSFAEEQEKNGAARRAQRAQDTDFHAATDDADGDGVVDEERSDDERDIAEDPQVPAEGAQHAAVFFAARAGFIQLVPWRKGGADLAFSGVEVLFRVDEDGDLVQPSI